MRQRGFSVISILGLGLLAVVMPESADGQIFVGYFGSGQIPAIAEYSVSGAALNAELITGLSQTGLGTLVVSGSDLFVEYNGVNGTTIGEYTTSGVLLNPSVVPPTVGLTDFVVSGSDVFVTNAGASTVAEYTTSGATVNASLIWESDNAQEIAVSGSDLFVTVPISGMIDEYTTSGTLLNASFISGLTLPGQIVVSGSDLFIDNNGTIREYTTAGALVNDDLLPGVIANGFTGSGPDLFVESAGTIGEYTTSGATVNAGLIPFVNAPGGIAVVVPEPSAGMLVGIGCAALLAIRRRSVKTPL
jgi:hypothetical protein